MNENEGKKRREWVKNAAIIFLTIMLILTFFSNTIMNYSLPEVATQYVQNGTITAKVRGTGNVEATDPYSVMVKDTRVISSVAVKQGDTVEKDQVLYYLEDKESDELKQAEQELADLELAYMKGLFGGTVSPEVINKVASGNTDSFSSYKAMVTDMQTRLQAAEDRVNECQKAVESITLENTISSNNKENSTSADELEEAQATADKANAEAAFKQYQDKELAELKSEIKEKERQIEDLETLIREAQSASGSTSVGTGTDENGNTESSLNGSETLFEQQRTQVEEKINEINDLGGNIPNVKTQQGWPWENEVRNWYNNIPWTNLEADIQKKHEAVYGEYRVAVDSMNATAETLREYGSNNSQQSRLESLKNELLELQKVEAEIAAISVDSSEGVQDAKNRLEQAQRNIREITSANKQASAAAANRLANAEAALKNAQAVYELLKTEQTELAANINAELDLSKATKDIANKKAEIEKLKENSTGATINAPVAGTVTNLAYAAGETTKPEEAAAVETMAGDQMLYAGATFFLDPAMNRDLSQFHTELDGIIDKTKSKLTLRTVVRDDELRQAVEPLEDSIVLMKLLYPVVLALSLLVAAGIAVLFVMTSAKEAAIMRVLGTSKLRSRVMLALQTAFTSAAGLLIGLAGVLAYTGRTRPELLAGLVGASALCAVLYLLAAIIGAAASSTVVTSKNPLELLQVRE